MGLVSALVTGLLLPDTAPPLMATEPLLLPLDPMLRQEVREEEGPQGMMPLPCLPGMTLPPRDTARVEGEDQCS